MDRCKVYKDHLKANCTDDEFKQQLKQDLLNEVKLFLDALRNDVVNVRNNTNIKHSYIFKISWIWFFILIFMNIYSCRVYAPTTITSSHSTTCQSTIDQSTRCHSCPPGCSHLSIYLLALLWQSSVHLIHCLPLVGWHLAQALIARQSAHPSRPATEAVNPGHCLKIGHLHFSRH